MISLWDHEPGAGLPGLAVDILAQRYGDRLITAFPADVQGAIALQKVVSAAVSAITAAAAGGPLVIAGAVVAAFQAIDGALASWGEAKKAEIMDAWRSALSKLGTGLTSAARVQGTVLTTYQPADNLSLKRAQAFTAGNKKHGYTTLGELVSQFRPGYVVGVKRAGRSDYIAATVPVLIFTGHPLGTYIPPSIYEPKSSAIGPLGDEWGTDNVWRPLGMYRGAGREFRQWLELISDLIGANGCPPIRQRTTVAPGLGGSWGPRGESLPMDATIAAYAASLLGRPPPDLDFVAERAAAAGLDPQALGILDLLWSREDLRRRGKAPGAPLGDAWAGPWAPDAQGSEPEPDPGPAGPGLGGGVGRIGEAASGGGGGGDALGVAAAAAAAIGLGALVLRKRRR